MNSFIPTNPKLFFSKDDKRDLRLGDLATPVSDIPKDSYCLLGYPDHEGINLNGGRVGAAEAPAKIREYLYKMTPPKGVLPENFKIADCGDLNPDLGLIAARHTKVLNFAGRLQAEANRILSFGGGHDYGYPDAAAFVQTQLALGLRPVVINFDAHLDVRPTDKGLNSGTPFFRLLNEFKSQFDFFEIGLQPQCNSPFHAEWAESMGASLHWLDDVRRAGGPASLLKELLGPRLELKTPVFVSFDIDSLNSAQAPGCSQSWATGLELSETIEALRLLKKSTDLKAMGIYEVSPPLDICNITAKSAAILAYNFLFGEGL